MASLTLKQKLARVRSVGPEALGVRPVQPSLDAAGPGALGPHEVRSDALQSDTMQSEASDMFSEERPSGQRASPASLRAMLEALADRHARKLAAERQARSYSRGHDDLTGADVLAWARARTAWTSSCPEDGLRVLRYSLEPDHHHGRIPISAGLKADPSVLAELALDSTVAEVDLERVLFIDTETTGLSLGGGTVPFLVGLAYFEDGVMVVEQLFLDSLAGEVALLNRLKERVEAASALVTYNGKTFDWPLLTTRFVLNRVSPPSPRPHLDLLTCARRVYRARLGSVRLVQMEIEVLGHRRERDISGAEIPGTYWSYQRHGVADAVLPILEHNLQDLVALAALQGELAARYREVRIEDDPTDQWSRARVAFRARSFERALSFAQAAIDGGAASTVAGRAALLAAEVHRKHARYEAATEVLEASLGDLTPQSLEMAQVRLALAKLWEHRLKDLKRAFYHAQATELAEGQEGSERRQSRLRRRLARRGLAVEAYGGLEKSAENSQPVRCSRTVSEHIVSSC